MFPRLIRYGRVDRQLRRIRPRMAFGQPRNLVKVFHPELVLIFQA